MNKLEKLFFEALMEHESQERLSRLIKQLRGEQSQRAFAKTLGVSYAAVRSWEECETMPGIKSLQKIATYSKQSVENLLNYLKYGDIENQSKLDTQKPKVAEDVLAELNYLPEKETSRLLEILIQKYLSKEESAKLAKMLINKLAQTSESDSTKARVFLLTDQKN
ncbi:MAG: helix-turn-helix transcriptional regulator [Xenococcaceae cyanobacterium MO_234.B1]|nr:helix-turn-helix transcriptional regulator [Xenococcaceae cyanobacterium MO_234.B1]